MDGPEREEAHGVVVDADTGNPVAGATVFLVSGSGELVSLDRAPPGQVSLTDSAGRFTLSQETGQGLGFICVRHPGFIPCTMSPSGSGSAGDGVTISLVRGGSITGRVVGTDGYPLEGVHVVAMGTQATWESTGIGVLAGSDVEQGEATTNVDGRFAVGGLVPGHRYLVDIRTTGLRRVAPVLYYEPLRVVVGEAVDITVEPVAGIHLRVLDSDGEEVAGVQFEMDVKGLRQAGFIANETTAVPRDESRGSPPVLSDAVRLSMVGVPWEIASSASRKSGTRLICSGVSTRWPIIDLEAEVRLSAVGFVPRKANVRVRPFGPALIETPDVVVMERVGGSKEDGTLNISLVDSGSRKYPLSIRVCFWRRVEAVGTDGSRGNSQPHCNSGMRTWVAERGTVQGNGHLSMPRTIPPCGSTRGSMSGSRGCCL